MYIGVAMVVGVGKGVFFNQRNIRQIIPHVEVLELEDFNVLEYFGLTSGGSLISLNLVSNNVQIGRAHV